MDTLKLLRDDIEKFSMRFNFKFYILDMREMADSLHKYDSSLFRMLSKLETEYVYNLKLDKNKVQWISGRCAVKHALFAYKICAHSFMNLQNIDVLKGSDSAPFIRQYTSLKVSITHSFPYCIAVVSDTKIGIDLEQIFEAAPALIKYFYSYNEGKLLERYMGTSDYASQAAKIWTRKEAVSKFLGLGMKMKFKSIDTSQDVIVLNENNNSVIKLASSVCDNFCFSLAAEG